MRAVRITTLTIRSDITGALSAKIFSISTDSFQDEEGDEYSSSSFGGFRDYFRRKKIKLQNRDAEMREHGRALALQNQSSPNSKQPKFNPNIFRGVVAHVTGYTQPSLADLHKLVVTHGGGFLQYLNGKTAATHIIASSLTPKKRVEYRRYRIVKPAWVVDSVKAGKLLPWDGYRVISGDGVGAGQKVLGRADGGKIVNAREQTAGKGSWLRREGGYRDQTDASWYTKRLLGGNGMTDVSNDNKSGHGLAAVDDEIDAGAMAAVEAQEIDAASSDLPDENRESINNIVGSFDTLGKVKAGHRDAETMTEHSEEETISTKLLEMKDLMDADEVLRDEYGSFNEVDLQNEATLMERCRSSSPSVTPTKPKIDPRALKSRERCEASNTKDKQDKEDSKRDSPIHVIASNNAPKLISDYRAQYTGEDPSPVRHFPNGDTAQTAEEHNAIILADPRIRKSTAANPDFLEQYYRESRLHHLSTWKAELKSRMQSRAAEQTASQQSKSGQRHSSIIAAAQSRRYILHVDFDSFFAAVSLIKNPELQDKPAVVAHGRGSGSEIASCNYPARAFGIKNGMWMRAAQDLCPDLHILPYDFPAYEKASEAFYSAILDIDGGIVQSVSIDEALVDITVPCVEDGIVRTKYLADNQISPSRGSDQIEKERVGAEQAHADDIAHSLRAQIRRNTGCNVSIGIGGNILLAKVALRKAKPAGQYHLRPENVLEYMGGLSLQDLPGVAWSIGGKLEALIRDGRTGETGSKAGIANNKPVTISDLRTISLPKLISILGPKTGTRIYEHARGIDRTPVGSHQQTIRKSVSAEVNWGIRFAIQAQADDFVRNLCVEVSKRLTKEDVKGKQVTVKMMRRAQDAPLAPPKHLGHGRCDVFSKSVALGVATRNGEKIGKEALGIMRGFGCPPGELRGIGVQVTRLEPLGSTAGGNLDETNDGNRPEGSQKKLQFIKAEGTKSKRTSQKTNNEASMNRMPIQAPPPQFSLSPLAYLSQQKKVEKQAKDEDPIEDELDRPDPLEKLAVDTIDDDVNDINADSPARKPLNTLGTQFLMPTQVDASVLAELPGDVRAKLSRRGVNVSGEGTVNPNADQDTAITNVDVSNDKTIPNDNNDIFMKTTRYPPILPTQSQLDPEVLAALPAEVRAEILSEYQIPQQQQQSADHVRPVKSGATASPSPSVYLSAHLTPNTTPQSASACHSGPKTPSSSILRQSVRNIGRRFQGSSRSVAARRLDGSPSPSPSPHVKTNASANVNANGSGSGNLMTKGRLQLLPPLVSASAAAGVAAHCGIESASFARPRSAASNSGISLASGIGTGSSGGTKANIKIRGSTRGRPRGRPPGIRAKPRSIPSISNSNNHHSKGNSITSNNIINHSYYKDNDINHATLTLTQANFVPSRRNCISRNDHLRNRMSSGDDDSGETDGSGHGTHDEAVHSNSETEANEISPDFLAALPPEIRTEVLRQHQQQQQQKSGRRTAPTDSKSNNVATNNTNSNNKGNIVHVRPKRVIKLPSRPPKPTFSTRHLSEPDDLRAAIKDWYAAFRDEGGPYREDVDALVGYLRRVVGTNVGARAERAGNIDHDDVEEVNRLGEAVGEGNMAKATSLVRWLEWVVEEGEAEAEAEAEAKAEAKAKAKAKAESAASSAEEANPGFRNRSDKAEAAAKVHQDQRQHQRSSSSRSQERRSFHSSNSNATRTQTQKQNPSFSFSFSFSSFSSPSDSSIHAQSQHHRHHQNEDKNKNNTPTSMCTSTPSRHQEQQEEEGQQEYQQTQPQGQAQGQAQVQQSQEARDQDLLIPWSTAIERVRNGVEDAIAKRLID